MLSNSTDVSFVIRVIETAYAPNAMSAFIQSYAIVSAAELFDKTFFVALVLALKHKDRKTLVFWSASSALLAHTILAAVAGGVLASLADQWVLDLAAGLLYLFFAILYFYDWYQADPEANIMEGVDEAKELLEEGEAGKSGSSHTFAIFSAAFATTFIAEIGDRTQIAMIGQHASQPLIPVCIGSALAFFQLTLIAVLAAKALEKKGLAESTVMLTAAISFAVFAHITFHDCYENFLKSQAAARANDVPALKAMLEFVNRTSIPVTVSSVTGAVAQASAAVAPASLDHGEAQKSLREASVATKIANTTASAPASTTAAPSSAAPASSTAAASSAPPASSTAAPSSAAPASSTAAASSAAAASSTAPASSTEAASSTAPAPSGQLVPSTDDSKETVSTTKVGSNDFSMVQNTKSELYTVEEETSKLEKEEAEAQERLKDAQAKYELAKDLLKERAQAHNESTKKLETYKKSAKLG